MINTDEVKRNFQYLKKHSSMAVEKLFLASAYQMVEQTGLKQKELCLGRILDAVGSLECLNPYDGEYTLKDIDWAVFCDDMVSKYHFAEEITELGSEWQMLLRNDGGYMTGSAWKEAIDWLKFFCAMMIPFVDQEVTALENEEELSEWVCEKRKETFKTILQDHIRCGRRMEIWAELMDFIEA